MKLKRNLMVAMMSLMVVFSAMIGYAATTTQGSLLENIQGGRANLKAHAYLTESGFMRHTGKASGTLYGEDKDVAGNYRIEGYYGEYEPDTWSHMTEYIGLKHESYYEELIKTGWFDSVYCDIYEDGDYNPDNILCHDEDED